MPRTQIAILSFASTLVLACSGTRPITPTTPAAPPASRAAQVVETPEFQKAVAQGTRTETGVPGPRYWQQRAEYKLAAELNPLSKRLRGQGTVTYHNNSPDALAEVYVHLYDNLYAPGSRSNTDVPAKLEGVPLAKVVAEGQTLSEAPGAAPGYSVDGTVMRIRLPKPIAPGGSAELAFEWTIRVPPDGAPRGGQDGEVWYLAYWYPQMAVYDDVNGWQIDQYLGNAEFYMGYGDYDVSLTLPAGWLVGATGTLQNAADVLTPLVRARLDSARQSSEVVRVVTDRDRGAGTATTAGTNGKLTWHFSATNVRDFAWGASPQYLWDATRAIVGDTTGGARGDTVAINAFYRPKMRASYWQEDARYGRHSIEFLSRYLWKYPYPHMTAMDGPQSCGGMEYPMMTCIGGQWDTLGLYEVTVHEIGHMWFPMQVGSDEKRFSWQDEGLTQFDQSQAIKEFWKGRIDDEAANRQGYINLARGPGEVELMRHGDRYPNYGAYGVATYYKMAAILGALRSVLGEDTFNRAYREYGRRWSGKHPTPYDFWHTFEDVSHQDLDWFWQAWFFETWKLDQGIDTVAVSGDSADVVLVNRGRLPMPVPLAITHTDGTTERITVPVDVWLGGERRYVARIPARGGVKKVEIDPEQSYPDIDRSNQSWSR